METTPTRLKVDIDAEACEGHGRCYMLAPTVFAPDDDGHGTVIVSVVDTPELAAAAELAMRNCPESAIHISPTPDA